MHQYRWTAVTNLNDSQNCRTSTECQSSQRKIRNIQSESVSKTECFTTRCNTTTATAVSTGLLRSFQFLNSDTLFSCLQLWTKNTKEVTLWVTNEVFTRVRARQKSVTCSKTQSQPRKTKCAPKVRRESVWLFPTASIFQTHQAVKLLYLKSIYFYHPSRDIRWTILFPRNQEELLEQLTVSLGHVECRHSHYPATPPVYRSEKIVNPVFNASGRLDFLPG